MGGASAQTWAYLANPTLASCGIPMEGRDRTFPQAQHLHIHGLSLSSFADALGHEPLGVQVPLFPAFIVTVLFTASAVR